MNERLAVLVVGAGPVGLTAALALTKANIGVRIIDAAEDVDRRMRASTFHPPTLDIATSLGIGDAMLERGRVVPRFQYRQHESGEYVSFDLACLRDVSGHPYRLQLEQADYCELAGAALAARGISVEYGVAAGEIHQDENGVSVKTNAATIDCQWLIGADGAAGATRRGVGLAYEGRTYTHSSVLVACDFPFHEYLAGLDGVNYCWSDRGPFSLLRLRDCWRASLYPGVLGLDEAADEGSVRDWLAYIHPQARDANLLDISPYRVHEKCVPSFRAGRVLLAGDAAHLNPPSGGMGMNGGIHDAVNATDKLLRVIDGADPALLDAYDRQRRGTVSRRINPQAAANRARMAGADRSVQMQRLRELRQIQADAGRMRNYLLSASMISGLREAADIA